MTSYIFSLTLSYLTSVWTWFFLVMGLIVGSFLNVCINRIPFGTFWHHARSHCPYCNAPIPAWLNIPVVSYLLIRGKARCCGQKISIQYPLVEAFTGIMFVIIYWHFPFFSLTPHFEVDAREFIRFVHASIFVSLLIVCSVIDLKHMIIPDVISLPMILLTPLVIYLHPELDWHSGLVGVVMGGGVLYGITWLYWLVRHEVGMGMGDVKLLAAIGGWLGYQSVLPTIFYGSILGSFIGISVLLINRKLTMKAKIPFGPFLAIGALIHLFLGNYFQAFLFGS